MSNTKPLNKKVSVIIPTCRQYTVLLNNLNNLQSQDYQDFEILVCDDTDVEIVKQNRELLKEIKKVPKVQYLYVARYDSEQKKDYGLARARNFGIINATGEILVFLDDRITTDCNNFITIMANKVNETYDEKVWYFGDKGAHKTTFVENCSAIKRKKIIDAGMFCERIDKYGGMTKEVLVRYTRQGFRFVYVPEALAKATTKSTNREQKEKSTVEMKNMLRKMGY